MVWLRPTLSFSSIVFLIIIIIILASFNLTYSAANNIISCPEVEKQSLLSFKKSLKDPNKLLWSWNDGVNCCNWTGVVCSNSTGHVHELHLHGKVSYVFPSPIPGLSGKLSPSLLNLTHLTYLDLSHNTFVGRIPSFIESLPELQFLDLSNSWFEGKIPTFCNATKLRHIDLSFNFLNSTIPDCLYLSKSSLEFVDLRYNGLTGTISSAVANLTSLNFLNLENNHLSGETPKELIGNLCKLQELVLSQNNLQGDIFLGNLSQCFSRPLQVLSLSFNQFSGHLTDQFGEIFKNLEYVDLSGNSFSGAIPTSMEKVSVLCLDYNKFNGNLPQSLGQLSNLEELLISHNMLEGVVTESHFVNLTKLKAFYASRNHLSLKVTPNWNPPFQLQLLEISGWNLSGLASHSLSWIQNQTNMWKLDLSNTGISFIVPTYFWDIEILNLSHNYLHGNIRDIQSSNSKKQQLVYLSSNLFSGLLPRVGATMRELDLSSNAFSGGMSHFLCDTTNETYNLRILHLGGNNLSGALPDCWMGWASLKYLNLGNNSLFGSIPHSIGYLGDLQSLNLYKNNLSGMIPFSLHNCTNLLKIDLSQNNLDGNMPQWIGTSLVDLKILSLRSNELRGEIPHEICHLQSLQILDLSGNKISGIIPKCVHNFTAMATKRIDDYPFGVFDYSFYMGSVIESASVDTKGRLLQYDTILRLVTNIDLSNNNLSGEIPEELTSLVGLISLNLSENHLTGLIPEKIGDMKRLESLDLSFNSLSGQIPNSLALSSALSYLDLSYNRLTGRIPESTQMLTFNASSFYGNNLCGPPSTRNCSSSEGGGEHKEQSDDDDDDKPKIEWVYVFLSLGYAVGFSGVCTLLVLNKWWRDSYFGIMECIWDKLYVFVHVKWMSLRKPSPSS